MSYEPMQEKDARPFIHGVVRALLKEYAVTLFAFLGIANLVAFWALWASVASSAREAAKTKAEESTKEALKPLVDRIKEMDGKVTELLITFVGQTNEAAALAADLGKLKETLRVLHEANPDVEKTARVVDIINKAPETKQLLLSYSALAKKVLQLNADADAVDDELDQIGQAGVGGVWNIFFNQLGIKTNQTFNAYHGWMEEIHKDAITRKAGRLASPIK